MSADGTVDVLVKTVAGTPLIFASNVVEVSNGTIWFTVTSRRWDRHHYLGEFLEHSCTGPLVQRDSDGTVTVLRDDLKFANGVVLAPDASHLLVAESAGYRISRYWINGPKAGTVEPFRSNLPGLPENMSLGSDQLVWVGMVARRKAMLDNLLSQSGLLRTLLWNLPTAMLEKAPPIAWVMAFDLQGRLLHDLRTEDGSYDFVTSVAERDGVIVAGSLRAKDIVHIALPLS
jgi:sugar lactone lactonase YvrE